MATLTRFEEIQAWQKAGELSRAIYACSCKGTFSKDYGLRDQIRRASVSVMSIIAEEFERGDRAEFMQFLAIAKGSAGEVESQLHIAFDQDYISEPEFLSLMELTASTKRLLAAFMNYLKQSDIKGQKYK